MKVSMSAVLAAVAVLPALAVAAPVFYASQAAFTAAEPAATSIVLSGLSQGVHPNNLGLPGVTFSTLTPGSQSSALIVYGAQLGNNWFGDTLELTFNPAIAALGFDVLSQIDEPGAMPVSAPITESVYSGPTMLGSMTVTEASGFFGVSSATPITAVTIFSDCDTDCSSNVSGVSLAGTTGPGAPVPEPPSLILVLTSLAGAALLNRCRRK